MFINKKLSFDSPRIIKELDYSDTKVVIYVDEKDICIKINQQFNRIIFFAEKYSIQDVLIFDKVLDALINKLSANMLTIFVNKDSYIKFKLNSQRKFNKENEDFFLDLQAMCTIDIKSFFVQANNNRDFQHDFEIIFISEVSIQQLTNNEKNCVNAVQAFDSILIKIKQGWFKDNSLNDYLVLIDNIEKSMIDGLENVS
jgi:hypothetical protein